MANHFPILVEFKDEEGADFGGIMRDFFSAFWEETYKRLFDGSALLTPISCADVDMNIVVLGKILSHGYLCCGLLPTRLSFPILAYSLLGPSVSISRDIFMQSLSDFVSAVDRRVQPSVKQRSSLKKLKAILLMLSRGSAVEIFPHL